MGEAEKPQSRHYNLKLFNMKSVRLIMILLIVFFSISASAQVFTGGSFSFSREGGKYEDGAKKPSETGINISPAIGKFLSEKVAAGIALDFGISASNNQNERETITRSTQTGIMPFLRYYAATYGKFSMFGQANAGLAFGNSKTKFDGDVINETKQNTISLNIVPGVAYNLNDRISLETYLNFMNFGFSKTTDIDGDDKESDTNFGFGANLDNIANIGNITIGAIYKF